MNSKKSNEKIIRILSEMHPIRDENDRERIDREKMTEKAMKNSEEAPLAFPRKIAGIICAALWAFSVVSLIGGFSDLGVLIPFMLLSLGTVSGLNIPVFIKKNKTGDAAVAVIACAVCAVLAFGMLFVGGNR